MGIRPREEAASAATPRSGARSIDTSDEELARQAQRSARVDAAAPAAMEPFEELVRRLQRPLFGFLVVRVGNAAEAEELVQEAFLRAWTRLDRYDSRWRFSTWLFTLAKRLAVSRARSRRPDVVQRVDLGEECVANLPAGADPAEHVAQREEIGGLWRLAAELLTEEQRSALWLRYSEGLSNGEIAKILGRPTVTVRVLLFRARRALTAELQARERAGGRRGTGGERRGESPTGRGAALAPALLDGRALNGDTP